MASKYEKLAAELAAELARTAVSYLSYDADQDAEERAVRLLTERFIPIIRRDMRRSR
jgi:hypothetical protein